MAPAPTDYTQMTNRELYFSFAIVTSLFFLWGFSYGLLDVLNQHFLAFFGLTRTETTLLQFAYFIAYLVVAPPMGILMRKIGYKKGIHIGLALFSIGAVMFWPAAHYGFYGMFVAFTFVTASGLATLEVAANSYITVLGPPKYSALRLTLAQGFNGIATVIGPLIAAYTFFNGENANTLGTVQYVYLAMSCFGVLLNVLLIWAKLPEVSQVVAVDHAEVPGIKAFIKAKPHTVFGFFAEFAYVGAQVAIASTAIFYITEQPGISPPFTPAQASNMFSGMQGVFTLGRFVGVWYLKYVDPAFALFINGIGLVVFSILAATVPGKAGLAFYFIIFWFEAVCYPVIFSVATADLGSYAKLGAGLITAGVSGGAVWPAMTTALADRLGQSHTAVFIPMAGFIPLTIYGAAMWYQRSMRYHGKLTIFNQDTVSTNEAAIEGMGAAHESMEPGRLEEMKRNTKHKESRESSSM